MTARYIIADASKVSPLQFFDAMTNRSPEQRAAERAWRAEYDRATREGDAETLERMRRDALERAVENINAQYQRECLVETETRDLGDGRFQVRAA